MAWMRIVSWNMGYWSHRKTHDRAWRWLLDTLRPDVVLCQECVPPGWVRDGWTVIWERVYPESRQPWGTGIATRLPAEPVRLPEVDGWFGRLPSRVPGKDGLAGIHRADGWLASATIAIPTMGPVLVAAVHSPSYPIERSRLTGIDVTAMKLKKNPDLWFLDVLFYFLKQRRAIPLLVGGDFNASRLLDETLGDRGNNEFFDRIAAEGFLSLHRRFHDADERTFSQEGRGPHQLDYLYADGQVASAVTRCDVIPYEQVEGLSDHAPLVADIDVPSG
jgi:hypothetical protein